jgi:hypothetical protein
MYGRLFRIAGAIGGRVDTFLTRRRLGGFSALFVLLLGCFVSLPCVAQTTYPDRAAAMAACQSDADLQNTYHPGYGYYCDDLGHVPPGYGETTGQIVEYRHYDGEGGTFFPYIIAPVNPCDGMSSSSIFSDGRVLEGSKACIRGPVQPNGSQAMCGININPTAPPTFNRNRGVWETPVSVSPTGQICGLDGGEQGGPVVGPDGTPTDAPPIPDPLPPPPTTPPPKNCGDVSCYDPGSDSYCASSGGVQFCVPGATARGPGGCASSGDATLCAGAPNPPLPDPGKVPDPPTATTGSDTTTQSGGTTAGSGTTTVTTTTYSNTGTTGSGAVSSGAQAGDSTPAPPAPPSSSPEPPGTFSGGGSCTSPPACSGDAVMCGIARTQWATTCQVHKDLAGTSPAPSSTSVLTHTSADVWSDGVSSGDPVADAANQGNYDEGGLGFATACPLHDLQVSLPGGRSFAVPFGKGCEFGGWLRAIILAFATFAAAKITAGGTG